MKTLISLASGMGSRFSIGDNVYVYFGIPEGKGSDIRIPEHAMQHVTRAKVVAVKFDEGKVLYDLALWVHDLDSVNGGMVGSFYEQRPLKEVCSTFVYPYGMRAIFGDVMLDLFRKLEQSNKVLP